MEVSGEQTMDTLVQRDGYKEFSAYPDYPVMKLRIRMTED